MTLETDSGRRTPARLASRALLACQSDDRLVELARAGNERAFEAIVDRYRRPLLRYCGRILPASRAEDAVQQTLINAHTALPLTDEPVRLKPWLFSVARNAALNMLRQNGWTYDEIPPDFDGVRRPDQVFEERARLEETVRAVARLPARQRDALVMRELEGRSYQEIAAALDTGDGAVRQLLNRARVTLRTAATAMVPPPLLARLATASPSDGRRTAEVLGAIGAAGAAKAGATALVAGTLVVGAVSAPLPIGSRDAPEKRERAALAGPGGPTSGAAAVDPEGATRRADRGASAQHGGRGAGEERASGERSGPSRRSDRGEADERAERRERDERRGGSERDDDRDARERSGRTGGDPDDRSAPTGGDPDDRSGPSGSDGEHDAAGAEHGGSGSSGAEAEAADEVAPAESGDGTLPAVTTEIEIDSSGSGSSGSGSGSSDSGSSD